MRIQDRAIPVYEAMLDPNCDFARSGYFRKHYTAMLNDQDHLQRQLLGNTKRSTKNQSIQKTETPLHVPSIELSTLKAIDEREACLARLHALLARELLRTSDHSVQVRRVEVSEALAALRLAGINVTESIGRWRKRRGGWAEPFVWHSHNYLLKMLIDSFFIGLADSIAAAVSDPFHLRCFSPPSAQRPLRPSSVATHTPGTSLPITPPRVRTPKAALFSAQTPACEALQLHSTFDPDQSHTKHHLVRMWAAERCKVPCPFPSPSPVSNLLRRLLVSLTIQDSAPLRWQPEAGVCVPVSAHLHKLLHRQCLLHHHHHLVCSGCCRWRCATVGSSRSYLRSTLLTLSCAAMLASSSLERTHNPSLRTSQLSQSLSSMLPSLQPTGAEADQQSPSPS